MNRTQVIDGLSPERVAFITKVYGLLTATLGVAGIASVFGLGMSPAMILPLFLVALTLLFATFAVRKQEPINLICLMSFAAIEGLSIGPFINQFIAAGKGIIVTEALGITAATFLALTLYVFYSKQDFSYLGGFLFTSLVGLIIVGLAGMIFGFGQGFHLVYCYVGVLIFIGYVLFDTSNLINKHPVDEYVVATLDLFLDVINLFVHILSILGKRD